MEIVVVTKKDIPSIQKLCKEFVKTDIEQMLKVRIGAFETKKVLLI